MERRGAKLNEEWVKLCQGEIPEGFFVVTSMMQDQGGTRIVLEDEEHVVEIIFDGIPVLLRQSVEGVRMRTWSEIQGRYQDKSFFRTCFFYQVDNSMLVRWIVEESCGFLAEEELMHYCIVTGEEVIDIVATFRPDVTVRKV